MFMHLCFQVPVFLLFFDSSFYDISFPLLFVRLSWGVVYLLVCNNIFLNIRISFFEGARRFYVPPDNVFGHQ